MPRYCRPLDRLSVASPCLKLPIHTVLTTPNYTQANEQVSGPRAPPLDAVLSVNMILSSSTVPEWIEFEACSSLYPTTNHGMMSDV
jgi:hypothetical protein